MADKPIAKPALRAQDDLYAYVNDERLSQLTIPDDRVSVGGFADLDIGVEKILLADFKAFAEGTKKPEGPFLADAVELYRKALDFKARNALGFEPVKPGVSYLAGLKDLKDFNQKLFFLYDQQLPLPFTIGVGPDMKNATTNALYLGDPSLILPDTTYYAKGHPQGAKLLSVWKRMAESVMAKVVSASKAKALVRQAIAFDALLSQHQKSSEEWADYVKAYNPIEPKAAQKGLKGVDFLSLVIDRFGKLPKFVVNQDPKYLKAFKTIFNAKTFPLYKGWAQVQFVLHCCYVLSEEARQLSFPYRAALTGMPALPSPEKSALRLADRYFSEPIGIYYGKTYFGEAAKADITEIVKGLVKSYQDRLSKNAWLSPATKKKAIQKLASMPLKMAYPDKPNNGYYVRRVNPNLGLFDNVQALSLAISRYEDSQLFQPVDRSIWAMPGHMVNACYNPSSNDITFPAAILQAPFYSIKQSRAENLGGIGTVIGHEISHAFDNNGAQFDELGNLHNWWTKKDYATFKEKTQSMIDEMDGLPLGKGKVNGKLVVSESIADCGGIAAALQTLESEEKKPDYQAFFLNFARIWGMKMRPQIQDMYLTVDVHAPAYWRANMMPQNTEQWYKAFDVKPTDKMYRAPAKRVKIW